MSGSPPLEEASPPVERLWRSRLRWRLRGAWLWPVFVVLTLFDGVVMHVLPFSGDGPGGVVAGVLLAGFANLFVIAVLAPLAGRLLRRLRPDLPRLIAGDYAGTALLCAVAGALVLGGVMHRPAVAAEERDRKLQFAAVQGYVAAHAPERLRALGQADALLVEPDLYRTCVPGPDPRRWLCLFVSTDRSPPGVRLDGDQVPNSAYRLHGGFR